MGQSGDNEGIAAIMAGSGDGGERSCRGAFSLDRSKGHKAGAFHQRHTGDAAYIHGESLHPLNALGVVEFGRKVRRGC